jgi:hypothetical protein
MENGYRKYQELQEQGKFKADSKQLDQEIESVEFLVSRLQTKFEYIRGHVTELDKDNTRLTKTYSIMVDLDKLMSSIIHLRNMKFNTDKDWKIYNATLDQQRQHQEQKYKERYTGESRH